MTAKQRRRVAPVFPPGTVLLPPLNGTGHWSERARCAEVDPDMFFPEKGGSTRDAKKVCATCEVVAECLEDALRKDERFGIRGGKSERERRKLKRQQGQPQAALAEKTCISCGDTKPIEQFPARTNDADHGFCMMCAAARRHRITVSQLEEIRARREAGDTLMVIAEDYNVTHGYVSKLLNGHAKPAPDQAPRSSDPVPVQTGSVAA